METASQEPVTTPTNDTELATTQTNYTELATREFSPSWGRVLIVSLMFLTVLITIVGNVIVLASFCVERKLRRTFTIYIANLAVTDVAVGLFVMTFFTFDVLLGYWPFGDFICGVWIFMDYGMTFVSVFTLVAISVDRFWSVTWSVHYRSHNNRKKVAMALAICWLTMLIIWLPPFIADRVKIRKESGSCLWEPNSNKEYVIFIALGNHIPCIILVFCYIKVFMTMHRRQKIKPGDQSMNSGSVGMDNSLATISQSVNQPPSMEVQDYSVSLDDQSQLGVSNTEPSRHTRRNSPLDRERKIFISLSYIIIAYLICWLPYHIMFDIRAFDASLVPDLAYSVSYWLAYFNSTVNPFVYAYSSRDFRSAFIKVIKCYCCRRRN